MNNKLTLICSCLLISFTACIKDEPENIEADILSFSFKERPDIKSMPGKESTRIVFEIDEGDTDISNLTPNIEITEGATITPSADIPQDFSDTVTYVVRSQDKQWHKTYKVLIKKMLPLKFSFEEWTTAGVGIMQHPTLKDQLWGNANQGIALAKFGKVEVYPTRSTDDAYKGQYAAMLETQRGGKYFGFLIPIFSGSLFRGQFGPINMANFAKSVKFGQPHPIEKGRPITFRGYYKYKVGEPFYDEKDNIVEGRTDECSIYAVLYKITKGVAGTTKDEFLDGTNILTSDKIVAIAELQDHTAKDQYTPFDLPFKYKEEPNYKAYDYKLAIVFASSKEGDFYRGAIGSTLIVDEVEVICQAYSGKNAENN